LRPRYGVCEAPFWQISNECILEIVTDAVKEGLAERDLATAEKAKAKAEKKAAEEKKEEIKEK